MAMPEQRGDWDWSKVGNTWRRRPIDSTERWQSLTTTLIGRPPDNSRSKGHDRKQTESITEWTWT